MGGVGIMFAVMTNTAKQPSSNPGQAGSTPPAAVQPADPSTVNQPPASGQDGSAQNEGAGAHAQPADESAAPPPSEDADARSETEGQPAGAQQATYNAETFDPMTFDPLGELGTPAQPGIPSQPSAFEAQIEFSPIGAGLLSYKLSNEYETVNRQTHVEIQSEHRHTYTVLMPDGSTRSRTDVIAPMGALAIQVNGQLVPLAGLTAPVWRQIDTEPNRRGFEAFIVDQDGNRVLRIVREFFLKEGSHEILLDQRFENMSDSPLSIVWKQYGPIELPRDTMAYGGDKRRVRFGYLWPQTSGGQANPQDVFSTDYRWLLTKVIGKYSQGSYAPVSAIWPNSRASDRGYELVWTGLSNRYFGVAIHPRIDPSLPAPDKRFHSAEQLDRVLLDPSNKDDPIVTLMLTSERLTVAPGDSAHLDIGIYAGPLDRTIIAEHPQAESLGLSGLVLYEFGTCAICTFSWITGLLISLLRVLDSMTQDYAIAIILLVVIVRTILHPVTKWSQVRMQRFGKQMQAMAPKQKKIQEKYKDDKQKLQQEMAKLWREEGISPTGMLGCLPMFLQTPIWIALYATLYFAFELRQESAFYGLFQQFGGWTFLSDLAEPDRFVQFVPIGQGVTIPLMGEITSLNILPLLLGIVFYAHQKYMTPPTSASLTPEQEQQQKIIKVMMVVMFPIFMYNAPSGLALYFITNSTLAIFENKLIRSHAEKHGLFDLDKMKEQRKTKGGFMQRMQELAEQQKKMQQKGGGRNSPGRGGGRGPQPQRRSPKRR